MGKTIFMQPVTIMAANSGQEGYVEFSDHIITADWSVTADSLCKQHLLATMPKEKSTMLLYNVFSDYLIFGGSVKLLKSRGRALKFLLDMILPMK